jgi:uncharacterized protein YneF (UPF0154 family)
MAKSQPGKPVTIHIFPKLLRRIDRAAKLTKTNRSAFMSQVMTDYLDSEEAEIKLLADPRIQQAMMSAMRQPGVLRSIVTALGQEISEEQVQKVLAFMPQLSKSEEAKP